VLDVHRDAIEREDGTRVKAVTTVNGKKAAQIMIISGCDDGSMNMPDWRENLRFCAALQNTLETDYPTLVRPVLFYYRKYIQDLTHGSLLVEFGTHANSLSEAVYSAQLFAKSLSKVLKE
jgi:stage II sporulation protein P